MPAESLYAVVVGNGVFRPTERARSAVRVADLVIAADGGARHCRTLDHVPDVVVGDLDSLPNTSRDSLQASVAELIAHSSDKDETDLELALLLAMERGAEQVTVLGAVGGRLDMMVANVLLLTHPELARAKVEIWEGEQTAWLVEPPGARVHAERGDTVSLIPLGGAVEGITTHDLEYPLRNETLEVGPARGMSNVVSGPQPQLEFERGQLLVVQTPEPQ